MGAGGDDASRGLDAVEHGHPYVHEHDVRVELAHEVDRCGAIAGGSDDDQAFAAGDDRDQPVPHQRLVVHHEHAGHASAPGSVAARVNPRGPVLPDRSDPPSARTRSSSCTMPSPFPPYVDWCGDPVEATVTVTASDP